jgi:hypothetical protein
LLWKTTLRDQSTHQFRPACAGSFKVLSLWNQPHYRAPTFSHDLRANLCNVAIPGTGLPLSVFCYFKATGYLLIFCVNPLVCFFGAINVARLSQQKGAGSGGEKSWVVVLAEAYRAHLLFPEDWFSYWRLNCGLASWYWLVTKEEGFDLENKWTFLQRCMEKGVPCSPCNTTTKGLCIKHKNEEGGLGIHFFKNATQGGDWIIQEVRHQIRSDQRTHIQSHPVERWWFSSASCALTPPLTFTTKTSPAFVISSALPPHFSVFIITYLLRHFLL